MSHIILSATTGLSHKCHSTDVNEWQRYLVIIIMTVYSTQMSYIEMGNIQIHIHNHSGNTIEEIILLKSGIIHKKGLISSGSLMIKLGYWVQLSAFPFLVIYIDIYD